MSPAPTPVQWAVVVGITAVLMGLTALVTWELARQHDWYTIHNGVITLSESVTQIAPATTWAALTRLQLPAKFANTRMLLGNTPLNIRLATRNRSFDMLQLAYSADGGLSLTDIRRDETLLRYDPTVGFLVGSGVPEPNFLSWVATRFPVEHPDKTPVLLIGAAQDVTLNSLRLLSRVEIDAETYVARAHHVFSPAFSGVALVRGRRTLFVADDGPILINDVPWASVQANVDATAVVGGSVVTIDALELDTGGTSILDDPGELVVTVRQWSSDTTCTSFRNLNDAVVLESYEPGSRLPWTGSGRSHLLDAFAELDAGNYEVLQQHLTGNATVTLVSSHDELCRLDTGTIFLEIHGSAGSADEVVRVTLETQPVMCSPNNWQIVCQGRNTFLSSVAT